MRIRFTDDYNHVTATITTAFKKGMEATVAADIGEAAIAAKKAQEVPLLKDQEEQAPKMKAGKGAD